jgi:hypothetical protein
MISVKIHKLSSIELVNEPSSDPSYFLNHFLYILMSRKLEKVSVIPHMIDCGMPYLCNQNNHHLYTMLQHQQQIHTILYLETPLLIIVN